MVGDAMLPDDLGLQCAECGACGEQLALSWDSEAEAWLCQRCGDYLDVVRESLQRAAGDVVPWDLEEE